MQEITHQFLHLIIWESTYHQLLRTYSKASQNKDYKIQIYEYLAGDVEKKEWLQQNTLNHRFSGWKMNDKNARGGK